MSWIIESGRVGELALDAPIPAALLGSARYVPGYIADAQPIDAFRWDDAGITAVVDGGPFSERVQRGETVEPEAEELRVPAVRHARTARIRAIFVEGAGPTTPQGIGVGRPIAALPDALEALRPPLLGRDERVVRSASLPGVTFVIDGAVVTRIELWTAR